MRMLTSPSRAMRVRARRTIRRRRRGESPSEGSSSRSSVGRAISARPIATICRSPPLMRAHRLPPPFARAAGNSSNTRASSTAASSRAPRGNAPSAQIFDHRHRPEQMPRAPVTAAMPCSTIRCGAQPDQFVAAESGSSRPEGRIRPATALSSVVLPAPLAPRMATTSPARTRIETSCSARWRP